MQRTLPILIPLLLTFALAPSAFADTLLVDRVERSSMAAVPARGALMAQVEAQYGQPERRFDAVGKPPIARWVYPGFTVYFEYNHVVHAVVNKSAATEKGPKPAQ